MAEDKEELDFDTIDGTLMAPRRSVHGFTLDQLTQGTIIETKDPEKEKEDQDRDENGNDIWWTKEELLASLEDLKTNYSKDDLSWEEKIETMDPIVPDQVFKKILRPGIGGVITKNNTVLFHCNGYLEGSDEPFDSSVLRGKPILHRLDREDLLPGIMAGITSMRVHEKAEILIRPDYGFGELGCPPRIPENATLLYILEIKEVYKEGTLNEYEIMTNEELALVPFNDVLANCDRQRMSGNDYFAKGNHRDAHRRYDKAIRFLERYFFKDKEQEKQAQELLGKLYPNFANVNLKLNRPRTAMAACRKALDLDPQNVKALFHYAKVKYCNGEYDVARKLLERANRIKPGDSGICSYLKKIENRIRQEEIESREFYSRMGRALMQTF